MRVSTFLSSAVVGLAAFAVAMPLINGRDIVTIGEGGADTSNDDPTTTSSSSTTTSSTAATSTATSDSLAPQEMHVAEPNNGMWNKTLYDDSDKFNSGLWNPNATTTLSTASSATAVATGTADAPEATSTDGSSGGVEVSGGLSLGNGAALSMENKNHGQHCLFGLCWNS